MAKSERTSNGRFEVVSDLAVSEEVVVVVVEELLHVEGLVGALPGPAAGERLQRGSVAACSVACVKGASHVDLVRGLIDQCGLLLTAFGRISSPRTVHEACIALHNIALANRLHLVHVPPLLRLLLVVRRVAVRVEVQLRQVIGKCALRIAN